MHWIAGALDSRPRLIKVRQFSYGLCGIGCCIKKKKEKKRGDRERVFQISHINRSVERRRESIRWMRELFLKRAR